MSVLISCTVVGINSVLKIVIRKFSSYEKHDTITSTQISIALKLTIARFINTAVIPIIVNYDVNQWFTRGGLVEDVLIILLTIAFLDPIMYLINFSRIYKNVLIY